MTQIFFSAGESSGDMHGANLIRALKDLDPTIECVGLGGRQMAEAGMDLYHDVAGRAIMGFVEIVKHLGEFKRLYTETARRFELETPHAVVLIDYPGFNIQIAKRASLLDIPVIWYISPQVWAWKRGRIYTISRMVKKMLVILPFEEKLYRAAGVNCQYVGHPLLDQLQSTTIRGVFRDGMIIGLLPGSREQEVRRLFGVMLEAARGIRGQYPEARFAVPCVNADREAQVRAMAGDFPIETIVGGMYEVLSAARFCLVASGTATVETMLFGVPMVVLYRVAPLTYGLARLLVRVDHIAMVNILAGRRIVPEFVQGDATPARILPEALDLIADGPRREETIEALRAVRAALGGPGASRRAAQAILEIVKGAPTGG